jgi:hypothetical protein
MDKNLLLGGFAVAYGLFTLVMRFVSPSSSLFSKLRPMQERWGERGGLALHWISYTLVPLGIGLVLLSSALLAR